MVQSQRRCLSISSKISVLKHNYGGVKENGPHRRTENGTIRKYGLVRAGMALLDEVYHWGQVFQMLKLSRVSQSLPAASGSKRRTLQHVCMHATMLPTMITINLWTVYQSQLNGFLYKSYSGHDVSSQQSIAKTIADWQCFMFYEKRSLKTINYFYSYIQMDTKDFHINGQNQKRNCPSESSYHRLCVHTMSTQLFSNYSLTNPALGNELVSQKWDHLRAIWQGGSSPLLLSPSSWMNGMFLPKHSLDISDMT